MRRLPSASPHSRRHASIIASASTASAADEPGPALTAGSGRTPAARSQTGEVSAVFIGLHPLIGRMNEPSHSCPTEGTISDSGVVSVLRTSLGFLTQVNLLLVFSFAVAALVDLLAPVLRSR